MMEIGKWDPDELSLEDLERMANFIFLQTLRCPMTQINGFKIIYDFKDTSVKYLKYFTPRMLYLLYHVSFHSRAENSRRAIYDNHPNNLAKYSPLFAKCD
ncbi:hypothetical protein AVEN_84495-1 [Araneus ventricosus]|uniref:CRAL-TRIO domain-containing protein n=1 Tax=Araneus ventricosus TaxID=182803 RepID=A0A4Y2V356_ARAVE|nr:hypothetical protein AVEN_84495-1 [Araneus ventricosus]